MSKFIPDSLLDEMPPLYSTEHHKDPVVFIKLFCSNWTWFITEVDSNRDICFGYVQSPFDEDLGYFSLKELSTIKDGLGLKVERDLYFKPVVLSKVRSNK